MVATNLVTVYLYQTREAEPLPHVYQTRETIAARGGRIVEASAREVPGCEITDHGLWKAQPATVGAR